MKEVIFDPKMFIREPYWNCPKCKSIKSFGVLSIGNNHYYRRCKECRYDEGYDLPPLNKKILYLDQFAISNMEKILNPSVSKKQKQQIDKFWFELFGKLDTLSKLQLIICPDSITHRNESIVAMEHYTTLKRMYEQLSHGTSFAHFSTIERFQVCHVAENWVIGRPGDEVNINIKSIVHGKINEWQERLLISIDSSNIEEDIVILNKSKQQTQEQMNQLFESWKQIQDFNFDKQWQVEISSYGRTIISEYLRYIEEFAKLQFGVSNDIEKLMNTTIPVLVNSITDIFEKAGISKDASLAKVCEFLLSEHMKNVPFLKISTLMYTALARKAASGQKKVPKASFFNDVRTISCLMPYCDVMFIDKECAALLNEEPLRSTITGGTKIFSLNTKEEFLIYLDQILSTTPKQHMDKVKEVYGENWAKPYTTMYENR